VNLELAGYIDVASALYRDNLAAAKTAASAIVKQNKKSPLAAPALELSKAKTIEAARKSFNALSTAAIQEAKNDKSYKVAVCPKANANKGGHWLQKSTDEQIHNPYFGAKMPKSGSFKK
jgi:hypothetical protein